MNKMRATRMLIFALFFMVYYSKRFTLDIERPFREADLNRVDGILMPSGEYVISIRVVPDHVGWRRMRWTLWKARLLGHTIIRLRRGAGL